MSVSSISKAPPFNDGRGRYPDRIKFQVPLGYRDALRQAAEAVGVTIPEFIRVATAAHVSAVLAGDSEKFAALAANDDAERRAGAA